MKKFCIKCQRLREPEGFKLVTRGRTKVMLCGDCSTKKVPVSIAERDSYGEQARRQNQEAYQYAKQTRL